MARLAVDEKLNPDQRHPIPVGFAQGACFVILVEVNIEFNPEIHPSCTVHRAVVLLASFTGGGGSRVTKGECYSAPLIARDGDEGSTLQDQNLRKGRPLLMSSPPQTYRSGYLHPVRAPEEPGLRGRGDKSGPPLPGYLAVTPVRFPFYS